MREYIYNCTASPVDCAAQEGRVSPDGSKIVYSVMFGSLWQHNSTKLKHLGPPINSKLYLYDVSLPRPYFSGLAARYPDWSMLYWVMAGKRTDGYTNAEFADDQDYPDGHPAVSVTPADVRTVVEFIQQGAPRP